MSASMVARLEDFLPIQTLQEGNRVMLVSDQRTKQLCVMKIREVYDLSVYAYLAAHPRPGLPHVIAYFEQAGQLVVIEEYISGRNLASILEEKGTLEVAEAVSILHQLCEILAPLHRLDPPIVHRDIKPSNIMLSSDGRVSLIDFNSAKQSFSGQSRDTELLGTRGYAAPEQYGFSVSRPSTDVYGLGVLLNVLLTGHQPSTHVSDSFLSPLISAACRMDPERRPRNAAAFLRHLRKLVIRHEPRFFIEEGWRSWLPPGFRNFKLKYWILSAFLYLGLFSAVFDLKSESGEFWDTAFMRLWLLLLVLTQVAFWGDYRYFRSRLPGCQHPNFWLRWLVWAFYASLILMAVVFGFGVLSIFFL